MLGDTDGQLRAFRGLWAYHVNLGEYPTSLTLSKRFCGVAADRGDPADLLVGDRMIGTSLHYLGSQADARRHIERMPIPKVLYLKPAQLGPGQASAADP